MRIDDQLEVGERVLDLLALIKPDAADDLVRDVLPHQLVFNRPRLRVGAIEDRHHRVDVVRADLLDRLGDEVGLLELVTAAVVDDLLAALAIGPQPLVLAVAVLLDDGGRGVQDHLGRSVVLLEPDGLGVPEVVVEVHQVAQVGAAPLVDRLIGIADDREVAPRRGEVADEQVLRPVGVLVLVDHDVLELPAVPLAHLLGLLEELDRLEQQIVEIERVALLQRDQVFLVDLRDLLVAQIPGAAQRLGPLHPVLRLADAREGLSWRHQLVVDPELALGLLDDGDLIGRVVDHEVARQPDVRRFPPQQPRAQGMECRQPHPVRVVAQQRLDPLAHLAGRLVGEGDRQHLIRGRVAVADEIRDAIRDDARLPRTRARENHHGSFGMQDRFTLFGIELVEEIH